MKSISTFFFTIAIIIQSSTALATDYSDFDAFCNTLRQHEIELLKKDVKEGLWTEAEAEEEMDYVITVEQCVCYFQNILDGTNEKFTLYMQKGAEIEIMAELMADENYKVEELMDMPKYPEGLDITVFVNDTEKMCGIDTE